MRPSACIPALLMLDAMGTLVRLADPAPELRSQLRRRFGWRVSDEEARHALAAEITYYRAHLQDGRTSETLAALHTRCAQVLREALPACAARDIIGEAELTDALLAALRFEAFDDAAPALRRARDRGQRVVVVSNWDCSLGAVMERVGLAPWLDAVLTSAQVGAAKPSPVIFHQALELTGTRPAHALHVGDSVAEDVQGACAAGVPVLLLAREGSEGRDVPAGVRVIAGLDEIDAS